MMKKNGRIFGKINIIDFLVILVIIVAIAGIGIRMGMSEIIKRMNSYEIEYIVRVDNVREYTAKALMKQGNILDANENKAVGTITNVEVVPYKEDLTKSDGTRIFVERPDKFSVFVTIKAKGVLKDGAFFNENDSEVAVGRNYTVCTQHVFTTGMVVKMDDISEALKLLEK